MKNIQDQKSAPPMHFNVIFSIGEIGKIVKNEILASTSILSISFWYSVVLYISQVLEVVKTAENDIFSLISSSLMSIFSPNEGHQEK